MALTRALLIIGILVAALFAVLAFGNPQSSRFHYWLHHQFSTKQSEHVLAILRLNHALMKNFDYESKTIPISNISERLSPIGEYDGRYSIWTYSLFDPPHYQIELSHGIPSGRFDIYPHDETMHQIYWLYPDRDAEAVYLRELRAGPDIDRRAEFGIPVE